MIAGTCVSQVISGKWLQVGVHDDAPSITHKYLGSSNTIGTDLMAYSFTQVENLCAEVTAWQSSQKVHIVHKLYSELRRRNHKNK